MGIEQLNKFVILRLLQKAKWLRLKVLEDIYRTKRGHIGGTYSCIEIFVYLYYGMYGLNFFVSEPKWDKRDRFVVGKGHASLALYHIWKDVELIDEKTFTNYGRNGAYLSTQLNIDTPGVEYNSGSLGNAIGIASGMALAAKMDNKNHLSIALVGDGECSEGSIWESLLFASQNNLNNVVGIVDFNHLGVTDFVEHSGDMNVLKNRVLACGWSCEIIDGHSFDEIEGQFKSLRTLNKPHMIIADTVKGKGVSFMENGIQWHHSVPSEEQYNIARKELEGIH